MDARSATCDCPNPVADDRYGGAAHLLQRCRQSAEPRQRRLPMLSDTDCGFRWRRMLEEGGTGRFASLPPRSRWSAASLPALSA